MTPSKTITYITAVLGLISLGIAGTAFFIGKDSHAEGDLIVVETVAEPSGDGAAILSLLTEMQNIRLDGEIYTNPLFMGLKDLTVDLVEEPVYRDNPFAPIGRDGPGSFSAPSTVTTSPFVASSSVIKMNL